MGKAEVEAFLSALAVERNVSASTQAQARSSLLFLYKEVLGIDLPWLDEVVRARQPQRLPSVLNQAEVAALLEAIQDPEVILPVQLLYGSGLRLLECLRLRVKDLDLSRCELVVRDGKGSKDRITMVAVRLIPLLRTQLARVRSLHEADLQCGKGSVWMPWRSSIPKRLGPWVGSMCFQPAVIRLTPAAGKFGVIICMSA